MFLGGGENNMADSGDNWFVAGSDEELGEGDAKESGQADWTPDAAEILSMFTKLEGNSVLELQWKCPGRRAPSPERGDDDMSGSEDDDSDDDNKDYEEEKKAPEVSEFDFDDLGMDTSTKITPRRTPGSKGTPRSQKKVASMDNVLNKIRHQQNEKAAMKEARRGMGRSPRASPGRYRLGMTGSPRPGPMSATGSPRPGPMGMTGSPRPGGINMTGSPRPGPVGMTGSPRSGGMTGSPRSGGMIGSPRPGGTTGSPRPTSAAGSPRPGPMSATGSPRPGPMGMTGSPRLGGMTESPRPGSMGPSGSPRPAPMSSTGTLLRAPYPSSGDSTAESASTPPAAKDSRTSPAQAESPRDPTVAPSHDVHKTE